MSKIFLALFLFFMPLFGAVTWNSQHIFHLKKDEWGRVIFYERGKDRERFTYEFRFRWTLYDGKKVILLSNYRDFPKQHTLYFKFHLNTMRQILLNDLKRNTQKKTFLMLNMDSYDEKLKEVSFLIFIKDTKERLEIKYIDPKREGEI